MKNPIVRFCISSFLAFCCVCLAGGVAFAENTAKVYQATVEGMT